MRIGIDIRNIGKKRTGDEVVFFNLIKNLALIDVNNENEYILFTDIVDENKVIEIKNSLGIANKTNFKIVSLRCNNKFIWNAWTLPNYLRKNPVAIYHTQYITPFFISRDTKIITVIHDISFNFFSKFIKLSDLIFLKILIPLSIRRADRVIGVSKFTRDEIIKYYKANPEKVDFIYNAAGDEFLENNTDEKELEIIRKKYNLPKEFIFYIGTMQPRKNVPGLIRAYAKMRNRLPNVKLVLAGNKNAHNTDKEISKTIDELNAQEDIIFPGFIDYADKAAVFKMAKLFVFPSFYEGFGIPMLEAMSQNVPVLASDIPVHREIAGNAAVFFDPDNLDELAEKMYNVFIGKELRNKLINLGSRQVGFFSWEKTAEKILELYKNL